ncbi:biotin-dependent carboxyltransferase family protein [Stella sp.]|uniref:5-oxoprolinase subunit C family protein n=1 Tax=Stella sp. TaxID=2912054 RepID=UPI0035B0AB58
MGLLHVRDPGLLATVQDAGRYGWQRFGVVVAGAMDLLAYRIANVLVGNPPDAAAIEFTLTGGRWEIEGEPRRVAVTGAAFLAAVDGRPVPAWRSFLLRPGQVLTIGRAEDGLRGYLAVAGGVDVAPVLGSRSTHVRSGIGGWQGRALRPDDALPLGAAAAGAELELPEAVRWPRPSRLRVVLGPQAGHFGRDAIATLATDAFLVTADADRMGYRLSGPTLRHAGSDNIVSDGIALGSIQVPASGHPIVLLADRQPTGGYPKIATIVTPDIGTIAQVGPGASLRFEIVELDAARRLRLAWDAHIAALPGLLRPAETGDPLDSARLLGLNLVGGVTAGEC